MRRVKGLDTVMRNLNEEINKIQGRTAKGMLKGAIEVRRQMGSSSPKIPVDLGNLRASWFITVTGAPPTNSSPTFKGNTPYERKRKIKMMADHKNLVSKSNALVKSSKYPSLIMGFSANYAIPVHERYGSNVTWTRKGSGPGFFISAIRAKQKDILNHIVNEARIK